LKKNRFRKLIHGLGNGSNAYLSTWDLAYGSGSWGMEFIIVKWTGTPNATFMDQWSNDMTWAGMTALQPFRCMWTNELR
jgi:hypothetical protein